ncbi:MAG: hypothetical protein ACRDNG_05320 [Gaiellaceae bacterium]
MLDQRARVAASGSFRERVQFDLVERPHHAFGLLAAADVASFVEVSEIVAIEFGVAEGAGLLNLAEIAAAVTLETGVGIRLVGFDSAQGLPAPVDFRDHPEIWAEGDFATPDLAALQAALPADVELVLGSVATTLPAFIESLGASPIGFVSFDLDLYSSTKDALALLDIECLRLLPVVVLYFDDVIGGIGRIGSLFRSEAAGQLLAIKEFNARQRLRFVDVIRVLRHRRPLDREPWIDRMYALHVLDHPLRSGGRGRAAMSMMEHGRAAGFEWPL